MKDQSNYGRILDLLVWAVAAGVLLPLVLIGLVPLLLVLGVFWPVMILPVIVANEYGSRFIHEQDSDEVRATKAPRVISHA